MMVARWFELRLRLMCAPSFLCQFFGHGNLTDRMGFEHHRPASLEQRISASASRIIC